MVIRREAALEYAEDLKRRDTVVTDRKGKSLASGGDNDICLTALEYGWGVGYFPELELTHLTPPTRCTEEYLLKTFEARAYSEVLHGWVETGKIPAQRTDVRGRLGVLVRWLLGSSLERRMIQARARGLKKGEAFVKSQKS